MGITAILSRWTPNVLHGRPGRLLVFALVACSVVAGLLPVVVDHGLLHRPSAWPRGAVVCGVVEREPGFPLDGVVASVLWSNDVDSGEGPDITQRTLQPFTLRVEEAPPALAGLKRVRVRNTEISALEIEPGSGGRVVIQPRIRVGEAAPRPLEPGASNPCPSIDDGEECRLIVSSGDRICVLRERSAPLSPAPGAAEVSLDDMGLIVLGRAAQLPAVLEPRWGGPSGFVALALPLAVALVLLGLAFNLGSWLRAMARLKRLKHVQRSKEPLELRASVARLRALGLEEALLGSPRPLERPWGAWIGAAALVGLGWSALLLSLIPTLDRVLTGALAPAPELRLLWVVLLFVCCGEGLGAVIWSVWPRRGGQLLEAPATLAADILSGLAQADPRLADAPVRWTLTFDPLQSLERCAAEVGLEGGGVFTLELSEFSMDSVTVEVRLRRSGLPEVRWRTAARSAPLPDAVAPARGQRHHHPALGEAAEGALRALEEGGLRVRQAAAAGSGACVRLVAGAAEAPPVELPESLRLVMEPAPALLDRAGVRRALRGEQAERIARLPVGMVAMGAGLALFAAAPRDVDPLRFELAPMGPALLGVWVFGFGVGWLVRAVRWPPPPEPPVAAGLALEVQSGVIQLDGAAVDLRRPFLLRLARSGAPGGVGALLVEVLQQGAPTGAARLRFLVPLRIDEASSSLDELHAHLPLLNGRAFAEQLWPILSAAASLHGSPPGWRVEVDAAGALPPREDP